MIKFTIVRRVLVEEIYEVVAETREEALALAKSGEGLNETFDVGGGSFHIANSQPGFEK